MMRGSHHSAVLCLIIGLCGTAGLFGAGSPDVDLDQLRRECELFENILNTSLRQNMQNPLFIAEKSRGAYLEGYGVTFTYTVNLNRSMILFPKSTQAGRSAGDAEPISARRSSSCDGAPRRCSANTDRVSGSCPAGTKSV